MADQPGGHDRAAMRALLEGLLVGADVLLESVGDWADRLAADDPSPLTSQFLNQLGDEWPDALPPDPFCEQVAAQARARLSAWHPGWPHLWGHILRVTGVAVALADEAGIDPAGAYLVGICHDVAKLDELQTGLPHEDVGAAFAGQALRDHLPRAQIESIQAAIRKEGDDSLTDLLHDADKLDKIGAAGVLRRISTNTRVSWLPEALWRVSDDWRGFPAMHFDLSRDLKDGKSDFLRWFLPLAEQAAGG
ncbi:MAG: HD domain-containing protein [Anaerolineae bacterium]|nr:HD domain-containing protein [Anaerolineae bacterium]